MKQKVIIYGLGKNYIICRNYLNTKYEIVALTDSNSEARAGNDLFGVPIIDPDFINSYDFEYIILTPSDIRIKEEIKARLQKTGVSNDKFLDLQAYLTISDVIEQIRINGVVIYGTGYWAKDIYKILELFNIKPLCFADGELYGDDTNSITDTEISVISLREAADIYSNAIFFIGYDGLYMCKRHGNIMSRYISKIEDLARMGVYNEYFSSFTLNRYAFLLDVFQDDCFDSFPNKIKFKDSDIDKRDLFCINELEEFILQPSLIRGGTLMLSYLFCDHPNLLTLPTYFIDFNFLCKAYNARLRYITGMPLVIEILSFLNIHYDDFLGGEIAIYDKDGDYIPYTQVFNKDQFAAYLGEYILSCGEPPDFGYIFKSIHAAFANSTGKKPEQGMNYIIYYHQHAWLYDGVWLSCYFSKVSILTIAREPLRASFSNWHLQWLQGFDAGYNISALRNSLIDSVNQALPFFAEAPFTEDFLCDGKAFDNVQLTTANCIKDSDMLGLIDYITSNTQIFLKNTMTVFIRFEDLKMNLESAIRQVCSKLDLPFNEILLKQTQSGIEIFNKARNNSSFVSFKDPNQLITATSSDSLKPIEYGEYFNSFDIFRIEMIFKKFASYFNYDAEAGIPDMSMFEKETLNELFSIPFKNVKLESEKENGLIKEGALKGTLLFLLQCYLQAKMFEILAQATGEEFFNG